MREPGFYWVRGKWDGAEPQVAFWLQDGRPGKEPGYWETTGEKFWSDPTDYEVLSERPEPPK